MSKFVQDLKVNVKSKTWWLTVIGSVVVLTQLFGLDLTTYIGSDWRTTVDIICSLLVALGVHMNVGDSSEVPKAKDISTIDQ